MTPQGRACLLYTSALAEVERQLRARLSAGESWFAPDWEARLPRSFDPEHFYLTEAGPVIYFPLYSIAPLSLIHI